MAEGIYAKTLSAYLVNKMVYDLLCVFVMDKLWSIFEVIVHISCECLILFHCVYACHCVYECHCVYVDLCSCIFECVIFYVFFVYIYVFL